MSEDGIPIITDKGIKLRWYNLEDLGKYFVSEVNKNQIARLSENELKFLNIEIGNTLEKFNYK